MTILQDNLLTRIYCDRAGDYAVPNMLSPRDLVFRPDLSDINCTIFYLSLLSRSFSDHHLRCGGCLNLEFSKREKHSGWAIKTIYKK